MFSRMMRSMLLKFADADPTQAIARATMAHIKPLECNMTASEICHCDVSKLALQYNVGFRRAPLYTVTNP